MTQNKGLSAAWSACVHVGACFCPPFWGVIATNLGARMEACNRRGFCCYGRPSAIGESILPAVVALPIFLDRAAHGISRRKGLLIMKVPPHPLRCLKSGRSSALRLTTVQQAARRGERRIRHAHFRSMHDNPRSACFSVWDGITLVATNTLAFGSMVLELIPEFCK